MIFGRDCEGIRSLPRTTKQGGGGGWWIRGCRWFCRHWSSNDAAHQGALELCQEISVKFMVFCAEGGAAIVRPSPLRLIAGHQFHKFVEVDGTAAISINLSDHLVQLILAHVVLQSS